MATPLKKPMATKQTVTKKTVTVKQTPAKKPMATNQGGAYSFGGSASLKKDNTTVSRVPIKSVVKSRMPIPAGLSLPEKKTTSPKMKGGSPDQDILKREAARKVATEKTNMARYGVKNPTNSQIMKYEQKLREAQRVRFEKTNYGRK
jgi:hypothetical protein